MDLKTATPLVPSARTEGDSLVIAVRGEIDLHNSSELRTEIMDLISKNSPHRLVLNLDQVPYMDSHASRCWSNRFAGCERSAGKCIWSACSRGSKG